MSCLVRELTSRGEGVEGRIVSALKAKLAQSEVWTAVRH
jgi:hypothetical protein